MDPPPTSFSGRRRSSVIDPSVPPSVTSASPTPRKASTWDSLPAPSATPTASDINSRRASATTDDPSASALGYPDAGSIASRKASAWDETTPMSGTRASVSDIAGRRATALDRSPWDLFSGAPPAYEDSTWGWASQIVAMTSGTIPPSAESADGPTSERNREFYSGNINYIYENHKDQSLAIPDVEAIMYAYGIEKASSQDVLNEVDPQKIGIFNTNSQNKQILLSSTINFSPPKEPLSNLRHASKCFQGNLLSPLHFAAYVLDILKGRYLGYEPRFMILGIYSVLGVLQGSTNRKLTTKDVETFTRLWKVINPDEAQDLINMINDDHNGSVSSWTLYNLLYRRNMFGKQRIQAFDTLGQQNPSMFFRLLDKDEDGVLSHEDLHSFAAVFGRFPSEDTIDRVVRKLDVDGDGKVGVKDFDGAMSPILDGMTWDFWLVAILLALEF